MFFLTPMSTAIVTAYIKANYWVLSTLDLCLHLEGNYCPATEARCLTKMSVLSYQVQSNSFTLTPKGPEWCQISKYSGVTLLFPYSVASWWPSVVKVKESRNRPGVAQKVPGGLGSHISWHSAHECVEVVTLTHRPPLTPGNVPGTHFH
jgi:hypothetical protein